MDTCTPAEALPTISSFTVEAEQQSEGHILVVIDWQVSNADSVEIFAGTKRVKLPITAGQTEYRDQDPEEISYHLEAHNKAGTVCRDVAATIVVFINQSSAVVDVVIPPGANPYSATSIDPDGYNYQSCTVGSMWQFRQNGKIVGSYTVTSDKAGQEYIIK
jgi:hypothetical protein